MNITQQQDTQDKHNIYECNICLELALEPVITTCGHLFCWRCIYQWTEQRNKNLECPVCKGGISIDSLIPIYLKEQPHDPRKKIENIPKRPQPQRRQPVPNSSLRTEQNNDINGGGGRERSGSPTKYGIYNSLCQNWLKLDPSMYILEK